MVAHLMHAVDTGGDGPPVVLLHGQPGTSADFRLLTALLRDRYRVIVPDRPGYGRTRLSAGGFAHNAAAVAALLDALGTGPAIVVGHSWGGGVGIALAADVPDQVSGLLLVASVSPLAPTGYWDRALALPLLGRGLTGIGFAAVRGMQQLSGRVGDLAWRVAQIRPADRDFLAGMDPAALRGRRVFSSFKLEQRALFGDLQRYAPALASLGADRPVIVVGGDADDEIPPAVQSELVAAIPGARQVELAGRGHVLAHEAPDDLAALIDELAADRAS